MKVEQTDCVGRTQISKYRAENRMPGGSWVIQNQAHVHGLALSP